MHADNKIYAPDPSSDFVELAAEVFGLLSDATRIRMVLHPRRAGGLSVNALAALVEKSPSGVSEHLARLRMARMVTTRQGGTKEPYRLTDAEPACPVSD